MKVSIFKRFLRLINNNACYFRCQHIPSKSISKKKAKNQKTTKYQISKLMDLFKIPIFSKLTNS